MNNPHSVDNPEDDLTCAQAQALLPAHLEQALPPDRRSALQAHLKTCARCRRRYQAENALASRLATTLTRKRREPAASATWRMRHRIEHRIRREDIMTRTRQLIWGAGALALFAVIIGLFSWWQSAALPQGDDATSQAVVPNADETSEETLLAAQEATAQIPTREAIQDDVPPGQQQVVQLALYDFQESTFATAIGAFEEENPDIDVRVVYIQDILEIDPGDEFPPDFVARLAANADVSQFYAGPEQARQGTILDLRPFIESDATVAVDDFFPSALEAFQWQGGIWGVPTELSFEMIAYQEQLFDEAGLPQPAPGWTWDDFLTAAKTLTRPGGDQWGLVMPLSETFTLVQARGGALWDNRFSPPQIRLDEPQIVEAMRWYADLYRVHGVAPYIRTPEPDATGSFSIPGYDIVFAGRAAMWTEGSGGWSATRNAFTNRNIDVSIAPMPLSQPGDRSTSISTTGALGISAGTRNAQAAWRLVSYLSRQQPQNSQYEEPSYLPARRSVAEATNFWDRVDPELGEALRYAAEHSFYAGRAPRLGPEAEQVMTDMFRAILNGETTVEVALASAQAQMESLAAEAELAQTEATPLPPVATPQTQAQPAAGDVTIAFTAELPGINGRRVLQGLVEQFQETNPSIFVQLQAPTIGSNPNGLAQAAQTADCMLWQNPILNEETRQTLLSIDPLLDASAQLGRDDFYELTLAPFTADGELWGLPAWSNVIVLAYDRSLFDAAGLPYPDADWTVQEFREAALALTRGDGQQKQYGFVVDAYEPGDLLAILDRAGAPLVDDTINPPRATFDNPGTVAVMQWYAALSTEHDAKPLFTTDIGGFRSQAQRDALISEGRAAMWTDYAEEQATGHLGPVVGYAPLPAGGSNAGAGFQSTAAYFISVDTTATRRQACWQWIAFLSRQAEAALAGLPANRQVAQSPAYLEIAGAERAAAYHDTFRSSAVPAFQTRLRIEEDWAWLSLGWYWLADAYHHIVRDGVPVETALREAQTSADAYRACLLARLEVVGPDTNCFREVDPQLAESLFGPPQ